MLSDLQYMCMHPSGLWSSHQVVGTNTVTQGWPGKYTATHEITTAGPGRMQFSRGTAQFGAPLGCLQGGQR